MVIAAVIGAVTVLLRRATPDNDEPWQKAASALDMRLTKLDWDGSFWSTSTPFDISPLPRFFPTLKEGDIYQTSKFLLEGIVDGAPLQVADATVSRRFSESYRKACFVLRFRTDRNGLSAIIKPYSTPLLHLHSTAPADLSFAGRYAPFVCYASPKIDLTPLATAMAGSGLKNLTFILEGGEAFLVATELPDLVGFMQLGAELHRLTSSGEERESGRARY